MPAHLAFAIGLLVAPVVAIGPKLIAILTTLPTN